MCTAGLPKTGQGDCKQSLRACQHTRRYTPAPRQPPCFPECGHFLRAWAAWRPQRCHRPWPAVRYRGRRYPCNGARLYADCQPDRTIGQQVRALYDAMVWHTLSIVVLKGSIPHLVWLTDCFTFLLQLLSLLKEWHRHIGVVFGDATKSCKMWCVSLIILLQYGAGSKQSSRRSRQACGWSWSGLLHVKISWAWTLCSPASLPPQLMSVQSLPCLA